MATFLGLVTAGLAIALQDFVKSFAGWIFLLWRRPFDLGDRIEIGPHAGDVIDIRVFKFSILEIRNWVDSDQSTGRVVHIPNSMVLTESIANFGQGFQYIWNEIPVLLTIRYLTDPLKRRGSEEAMWEGGVVPGPQSQFRRRGVRLRPKSSVFK